VDAGSFYVSASKLRVFSKCTAK